MKKKNNKKLLLNYYNKLTCNGYNESLVESF